jgi:lipopolysaccharide export LptBFGC system permease protein LptF
MLGRDNMPHNRAKNERRVRTFGLFLGIVCITIVAFYVLAGLLGATGDDMPVLIGMVISIQLSFLIAYVIMHAK